MALLHVNFFARTLGMGMSMDVILPEGDQGIGVNGIPAWNDGKTDKLLHDGTGGAVAPRTFRGPRFCASACCLILRTGSIPSPCCFWQPPCFPM